MKVQKFYQDILETLGAKVTDAGVVLHPITEAPYQIGGKDVVIPTKPYLDANDWSEVWPFHPLCEDAMMGQSETYHFMLRLWRAHTTLLYINLIGTILTVAADPKLAKEVKNPDFAKLPIPNVKDTTIKAWKKLQGKFAKEHFLKLYVSRSGELDGTKVLRRADLSIPLLEHEGGKPFGLPISVADTNTIQELIKCLFEPILTPHGSNHATPYLDVLLQVTRDSAEQYNKYAEMVSKVASLPLIPLNWLTEYADMDKFRRHIPKLPGNEGSKLETTGRNAGVEPETSVYDQVNVPVRSKAPVDDDEPPFEPDVPRRRRDDVRDTPRASQRDERSGRVSVTDMLRDPRDLEDPRDRYDDRYDDRRGRRRGPLDLSERGGRGRDDRRDRRRDDRRDDRRGGGRLTLDIMGI